MISVIVPIYNEKDNIQELYKQIAAAFKRTNEDWELLLVDDGSHDGSIDIIRELCGKDRRIKGFRFSRNFGQYAAVTAGIDNAEGDAIIIMDADLQEPPSLIPQLVRKWKSGFKAVYTTAVKRKDSFWRRSLGSFFYKKFGGASYLKNAQNVSEMRLVDKEVAQAFKQFKERPLFIKGLFFWLGYKHTFVEYEKQKRTAGKSKYSFSKLLKLALDGIISFSSAPLRVITYGGLIAVLFSIGYAGFIVAMKLFGQTYSLGYAPFICVILFMGGIQLIALGIVGEYIGRIYDEVKQRPRYIIEEHLNSAPTAENE